jgi:hypothetical protein
MEDAVCDILNERIRINQILTNAIDDGFGAWSMRADELIQRCFHALQACYHGSCVDECLQARASEFVAAYLARRAAEAGGISPSAPPRTGR